MRITIFSLGGLLGQHVTNTALLHGAQVTAYVPDAKAIWPRKNLTVIEGSLQNRERVLEALLEADAVISVLTPMGVKYAKAEETPLADGNAMILSAMKQLGKTRFVTVGHVCIHAFGDCEDKYQRVSTKFMQIFWPGVYKDMQKMGQVLARSDLNWTLVRTCPGRDGKVKKAEKNCSISLDGSQFRPGYSREALAEFLYEAAASQQMYSRKMPIFYREG
ncbi:NAD(P)-dependent oxidoreductase [Fusicatenibacter sp.]